MTISKKKFKMVMISCAVMGVCFLFFVLGMVYQERAMMQKYAMGAMSGEKYVSMGFEHLILGIENLEELVRSREIGNVDQENRIARMWGQLSEILDKIEYKYDIHVDRNHFLNCSKVEQLQILSSLKYQAKRLI